ncbi:MAG: hypothetical protein Q9160_006829 [Pyrenula sp. 1 TL-2023]
MFSSSISSLKATKDTSPKAQSFTIFQSISLKSKPSKPSTKMHFSAITASITALLLSSSISALPNPSPAQDLTPRACSTISPSPIDILDASKPDEVTYDGDLVLNRTSNGNNGYQNTKSTLVSFNNIPWQATGCMLRLTIPKLTKTSQIARANPDQSGAFQADVWKVEADPLGRATWNTPPKKDQFVSTIRFPTTQQDQPFETYIWSGVCPSVNPQSHYPYGGVLSFLLEGSGWQQFAGDVRLYNSIGGKSANPEPAGLALVYNC